MRVGIGGNGRAMRRPARMTDTDRTTKRRRCQGLTQRVQLALGPAAVELAIVNGCDTSAVITAILEPLQAVKNGLRNIARADDANNTAHIYVSFFSLRARNLRPQPLISRSGARVTTNASSGTSFDTAEDDPR